MEQNKNNISDLLNVIEQIIKVLKEKYEKTKKEEYKKELNSYLAKYNRLCIKKEYDNWEEAKTLPDNQRIEYYEKLASLITKEPITNKKEIVLGMEKYIINGDYECLFKSCYKHVAEIRRKNVKKNLEEIREKIKNEQKNLMFIDGCYFSLDYYEATVTIKEKLKYCRDILESIKSQAIENELELYINGKKQKIDEKFAIPYTIAATLEPRLEKIYKSEKTLQARRNAATKSVTNYCTIRPQEYINNIKKAKDELLNNINEINAKLVEIASKIIEVIKTRTSKKIVINGDSTKDKDSKIVEPINSLMADTDTIEKSDITEKDPDIQKNSQVISSSSIQYYDNKSIAQNSREEENSYIDEKEEILKQYRYHIFECSEKYDIDQALIMTILYKTLEEHENIDDSKTHYSLSQIIKKQEPIQIETDKLRKRYDINNLYNFIENIACCLSNIKNIYRNIDDNDYKELFKAYSGWTNGYANYNCIGFCANYANECMKILELNLGYESNSISHKK